MKTGHMVKLEFDESDRNIIPHFDLCSVVLLIVILEFKENMYT